MATPVTIAAQYRRNADSATGTVEHASIPSAQWPGEVDVRIDGACKRYPWAQFVTEWQLATEQPRQPELIA